MLSPHSLGFPPALQLLDQIDHGFHRITLRARTTALAASCTACGALSRRVHGAYWRSLGDVACFGRPTILLVRIRRFRCAAPACAQRTFAEPLPDVARPRARQTDRLRTVHRAIGLALGGNPGARHAAAMGVPISRTTLLRRVRADGATPAPPVTVLGVDDWAWRKGHRYGTILCDLERRRVIDLLPDRSSNALAAWLTGHPSVSVVVRDRAGAYAEGAARGAPDAVQIADRWHLLRNSGEALQRILECHHYDLREAARAAAQPSEPPAPEEKPMAPVAPERRDARYAEAVRLREQGMSIRAVARALGVERKTVRRWLRAGHAPTWRHADRGTSVIDPCLGYLEERWQAGCRNAAALWRELKERGFCGRYTVVRDWGTRRRRQDPPVESGSVSRKRTPMTPTRLPETPTPRKAARLLTGEAAKLADEGGRFVAALLERSPILAAAVDLFRRFAAMVKDKTPDALDGWLREAEGSALASFAAGLRRDEDAVRAALSEPWSNGQVEGQVNRLKAIKRDMYGRASFELLRGRVLSHA